MCPIAKQNKNYYFVYLSVSTADKVSWDMLVFSGQNRLHDGQNYEMTFFFLWAEHSSIRVRGLRVPPFSIPRHMGRSTPSSGGQLRQGCLLKATPCEHSRRRRDSNPGRGISPMA